MASMSWELVAVMDHKGWALINSIGPMCVVRNSRPSNYRFALVRIFDFTDRGRRPVICWIEGLHKATGALMVFAMSDSYAKEVWQQVHPSVLPWLKISP